MVPVVLQQSVFTICRSMSTLISKWLTPSSHVCCVETLPAEGKFEYTLKKFNFKTNSLRHWYNVILSHLNKWKHCSYGNLQALRFHLLPSIPQSRSFLPLCKLLSSFIFHYHMRLSSWKNMMMMMTTTTLMMVTNKVRGLGFGIPATPAPPPPLPPTSH